MENWKVLSASKLAKCVIIAYFASNTRMLNHNGVLTLTELYIYLQCLIRLPFINFVCEVYWKVLKLRVVHIVHHIVEQLCTFQFENDQRVLLLVRCILYGVL